MQSNRERFLYSCAVKKERVYTLLCSPKEKQQCLVCSQLCSHVCSQKREGFVYSCAVMCAVKKGKGLFTAVQSCVQSKKEGFVYSCAVMCAVKKGKGLFTAVRSQRETTALSLFTAVQSCVQSKKGRVCLQLCGHKGKQQRSVCLQLHSRKGRYSILSILYLLCVFHHLS